MKKLITRCLALLAATCGLGAWAAVGDSVTLTNTDKEYSHQIAGYGSHYVFIPATADLPAGSTVTVSSLQLGYDTYSSSNVRNYAVIEGLGDDGTSKQASDSVSYGAAAICGNSNHASCTYSFSTAPTLTVGKAYPIYFRDGAAGSATSNTQRTCLVVSNDGGCSAIFQTSDGFQYRPAYKLTYTVATVAEAAEDAIASKTIAINFNATAGSNTGAGTSDSYKIGDDVDTYVIDGYIPGKGWTQVTAASQSTSTGYTVYDPTTKTTETVESGLTWSSANNYMYRNVNAPYLMGYLDDGSNHANIGITEPFKKYDVIVFSATDTASRSFDAVTVNGIAYTWDSTTAKAVAGSSVWGSSQTKVPAYGVNTLRINGLSGDLTIVGGSNDNSTKRGGIAAVVVIDQSANIDTVTVTDRTLVISEEKDDLYKLVDENGDDYTGALTIKGTEGYQVDEDDLAFVVAESASSIKLADYVTVDFGTSRTNPTTYTLASGVTIKATQTVAEYANGESTTITGLPAGAFVVITKIDGTVADTITVGEDGTATLAGDKTVKIEGAATCVDVTFTNASVTVVNDAKMGITPYSASGEVTLQYDNAPTLQGTYVEGGANKDVGINLYPHPWLNNAEGYLLGDQLTMALVGTMPKTTSTMFVHFGGNTSYSGVGMALATGTKDNEVVVYNVKGSSITAVTTMTVPNAASSRHVYIITKDDTAQSGKSVITVYLDGIKWKTVAVDQFSFTSTNSKVGIQVASDFGGALSRGNILANAPESDTGIINVMRIYDRVISDKEIALYSSKDEFPYTSPNGGSTRTLTEATENFIVDGGECWNNTATDGTTSVDGQPLEGAALTITGTSDVDTTFVINLDGQHFNHESLTINGAKSFTIVDDYENEALSSLTFSSSVIGCPVTIEYGVIDIGGGPTTFTEGGSLTFDLANLVLTDYTKTTVLQLTGETTSDASVSVINAPTHACYTCALSFNENNQWVYTITPNHQAGDTISWVSGYWKADGTGISLVNASGASTIYFDGDVVAIDDQTTATSLWVGPGFAGKTLAVKKDITIGTSGDLAASFSEMTVTIDAGVTVTLTPDTYTIADGSVAIKSSTVTGGSIKLNQTLVATDSSITSTLVSGVDGKAVKATTEGTTTTYTLVPDEVTVTITPVTGMTIDSVKIGEEEQIANEDGTYTVAFGASLTVSYAVAEGYVGTAQTKTVTIDGDTTQTIDTSSITAPSEGVAKVGDTLYASLNDAIAAATNETDTITMVKDWTGCLSAGDTELKGTLDLNGKTVTLNNGWSNKTWKFGTLVGDEDSIIAFARPSSGATPSQNLTIGDVSGYEGKITIVDNYTVTLPTGYVLDEEGYVVQMVTIAIPTVENTTVTVTIDGEVATIDEDGNISAAVGSKVVVKYAAVGAYTVSGATITITSVATDSTVDTSKVKVAAAVAEVTTSAGVTSYISSLSSITAASGSTIKLLADVNTATRMAFGTSIVKNRSVTLDLNGHDITITAAASTYQSFLISQGNSLTITGKGTISNVGTGDLLFAVGGSTAGTLKIGADVTVKGDDGAVFVGVNSTFESAGVITTESSYAISGNGSGSYNGTTVKITAGSVTGADGVPAIYHPQTGTLTVSGGTVTGGIEMKSGTLSVTGGKIVATGTATHTASGNGASTSGYAIAAVNSSAYAGAVSVALTGGTITGPVAYVDDSEATTPAVVTIGDGVTITTVEGQAVEDGKLVYVTVTDVTDGTYTVSAEDFAKAVEGTSWTKDDVNLSCPNGLTVMENVVLGIGLVSESATKMFEITAIYQDENGAWKIETNCDDTINSRYEIAVSYSSDLKTWGTDKTGNFMKAVVVEKTNTSESED